MFIEKKILKNLFLQLYLGYRVFRAYFFKTIYHTLIVATHGEIFGK